MSTAATSLLGAAGAEPSPAETALSPAERFQSSLRGLAIGIALFLIATLAGLFLTAALFNYSVGALV